MTTLITATVIAALLYIAAAFIQWAITDIRARKAQYDAARRRPTFTPIRPAIASQKSGVVNHLTIRQAKAAIKELKLAEKCREMTGKTWSRCSKSELQLVIADG